MAQQITREVRYDIGLYRILEKAGIYSFSKLYKHAALYVKLF